MTRGITLTAASTTMSKTQLRARILEVFREVERTGVAIVITDRGRPVLRLVPYSAPGTDPLDALRGCVLRYDEPLAPVDEDAWEALQ